MKAKILAAGVLLALLVILLFQNTEEVVFHIFFWTISMSQVILVPLAVLVGFLLGYYIGVTGGKKQKS